MQKRLSQFLVVVATLCVVPFAWLSRYVFPINDDYEYALGHLADGPFASVVSSYMQWSGRYLATFLSSVNPLAHGAGEAGYPWVALLTVVLFVGVAWLSCWLLLRKRVGRWPISGGAALLVIALLSLSPKISELFYWFSAVTAYTWPALLALLLFSLLRYGGRAVVGLQCLLAFLVVGGNEVLAVGVCLTLLYLAVEYKQMRLWAVALSACVGIALVIVSPGNAVRMAGQLSAHPYLWTVGVSLFESLFWLVAWLPSLLLLTLIYIPLLGVHVAEHQAFSVSRKRFAAFFLLTVILSHIPPALGLCTVMIGRLANSLCLLFVPLYFYGVNVFLHGHTSQWRALSVHPLARRVGGAVFISVLALVPFHIDGNVMTAYVDLLSGKAARYAEQRTARDLLVQRLAQQSASVSSKPTTDASKPATVELEGFEVVPKSVYVNDLYGQFLTAYGVYHRLPFTVAVSATQPRFESNMESIVSVGRRSRN